MPPPKAPLLAALQEKEKGIVMTLEWNVVHHPLFPPLRMKIPTVAAVAVTITTITITTAFSRHSRPLADSVSVGGMSK